MILIGIKDFCFQISYTRFLKIQISTLAGTNQLNWLAINAVDRYINI